MSKTEFPISINEHLSALLDDQAGAFEQRRVLDELKTDTGLSQKLSTYALIGETMRAGESEKPVLSLGSSFLDSIHDKIKLEDEFNEIIVDIDLNSTQSELSKVDSSSRSWFRPIGGFAVAASVGALAFMGLQNMGVLSNSGFQSDGIVSVSAPADLIQTTPIAKNIDGTSIVASISPENNDEYVDGDSNARSLLKKYVDSHMQYAASSAFVPSVRVIAYANNQ